jgi:hypothetical protein
MHIDAQVVTLVFTIVTGVGVLLQAFVLLGMFLGLRETHKKIHSISERVEGDIVPLVANIREIVHDLTPKIQTISSNLVETSVTVKTQAANVSNVVQDVSNRTRQQTARVDGIVTHALNTLSQASIAVERGISAPLRQFNGLLSGLRAGFDTLRAKESETVRRAPLPPAPAARPVAQPITASNLRSNLNPEPSPAEFRPEDASAAAARFVRDRAASERR